LDGFDILEGVVTLGGGAMIFSIFCYMIVEHALDILPLVKFLVSFFLVSVSIDILFSILFICFQELVSRDGNNKRK
jgi:hypothetical protein